MMRTHLRNYLSIHRAATSVAAVSIAGAGIFAVLPAAGASAAAVARSCGAGRTHGNIVTCVAVTGHRAEASAHVRYAGRTLSVCLYHGRHRVACTGWRYIPRGKVEAFAVSERGHRVPDGMYTAVTYRLNADGDHSRVGEHSVTWVN